MKFKVSLEAPLKSSTNIRVTMTAAVFENEYAYLTSKSVFLFCFMSYLNHSQIDTLYIIFPKSYITFQM